MAEGKTHSALSCFQAAAADLSTLAAVSNPKTESAQQGRVASFVSCNRVFCSLVQGTAPAAPAPAANGHTAAAAGSQRSGAELTANGRANSVSPHGDAVLSPTSMLQQVRQQLYGIWCTRPALQLGLSLSVKVKVVGLRFKTSGPGASSAVTVKIFNTAVLHFCWLLAAWTVHAQAVSYFPCVLTTFLYGACVRLQPRQFLPCSASRVYSLSGTRLWSAQMA